MSKNSLMQKIVDTSTKIKSLDELQKIVSLLRSENKNIVFTNGCFDILHLGHVKLLEKAKGFRDVLIVGVNSDSSIKHLKGNDRPINTQEERLGIIAALECVTYVICFNESTPINLISQLKPDIHVKGGEYNPNDYAKMPEAEVIHAYGGEVRIVPNVVGKSTTNVIEKILKTHSNH